MRDKMRNDKNNKSFLKTKNNCNGFSYYIKN